MITLYQFPLSHYCEKTRWSLDHKNLDFTLKNLVPAWHRPLVLWKTRKKTVPMIHDGDHWLSESTTIAHYLDAAYSNYPLFPEHSAQRQAIAYTDMLSDKVGRMVPRLIYSYILNLPQVADAMFVGAQFGPVRRYLAEASFRQGAHFGFALAKVNKPVLVQRLLTAIDPIEHIVMERKSDFLVGDQLTYADICVSSLMAPMLMIPETPWAELSQAQLPNELADFSHQLLERPIGQYISDMYTKHRHAKVDWRGQW